MNEITPFDSKGKLRDDLDAIDISDLPPERQQVWNALVEAARECEAAEAIAKAAADAVRLAVRAREDAQARLPRISFHDVWLSEIKGVPLPGSRS